MGSASIPMDRGEQTLRLVAHQCAHDESSIQSDVSRWELSRERGRCRGAAIWRHLLLLAMLPVFAPLAVADWISWEAGFHDDSGKAVISADGNPVTDGVAQLYHFHRVNFEAVLKAYTRILSN